MTGRIWLIAGPTASGKSALALRLAKAMGGEIVNADSMQLYAGLPVLTAGPTVEEQRQAPHHLFAVADPADGWSTGRWLRAAQVVIDEIVARNRPAVVVGGTGLYFHALTQGLAVIPEVPNAVRKAVEGEYADLGEARFRERLAAVDPSASARISPADRQRLVRAWAVYAASGRSLSALQSAPVGGLDAGLWRGLALIPPRPELYARCDIRLETMLAMGALEEVAALMARALDPDLPFLKAVGYREFTAHLRSEMSLSEALAAARQETRRYAKRQLTWIRGQMGDWPGIETLDPDKQWRQFLALNPDLTA